MRIRDIISVMPYLNTVTVGKETYKPEEIPVKLLNASIESCRAEVSRLSFKHDLIITTKREIRLEREVPGQLDLTRYMEMGAFIN